MNDRVNAIRRHKISHYQARLSPDATPDQPGVGDFDYVTTLSRLAAVAPRHLPLEFGSHRQLSELGLLGHVIKSCDNLTATLDIWLRHADMAGEPVRLTSEIREGENGQQLWHLLFEPLPFLSPAVARFCTDELLAAFFSFSAEVTEYHFRDFRVEMPYPAEDDIDFGRYFPCPVVFDQPGARIIGPAAVLDIPTVTRRPQAHGLLLEHLRRSGTHDQGVALGETSAMLRSFLATALTARPGLADAAVALGLSERTLHRRLDAEGSSFGAVLADLRRDYAQALVEDGTLCAKQIAHAVGYRSENCLRRAFTQWTGQPMGRWRREKSAQ